MVVPPLFPGSAPRPSRPLRRPRWRGPAPCWPPLRGSPTHPSRGPRLRCRWRARVAPTTRSCPHGPNAAPGCTAGHADETLRRRRLQAHCSHRARKRSKPSMPYGHRSRRARSPTHRPGSWVPDAHQACTTARPRRRRNCHLPSPPNPQGRRRRPRAQPASLPQLRGRRRRSNNTHRKPKRPIRHTPPRRSTLGPNRGQRGHPQCTTVRPCSARNCPQTCPANPSADLYMHRRRRRSLFRCPARRPCRSREHRRRKHSTPQAPISRHSRSRRGGPICCANRGPPRPRACTKRRRSSERTRRHRGPPNRRGHPRMATATWRGAEAWRLRRGGGGGPRRA
mmetsp:Transcript_96386/g.278212  ORF Transcript_96386/g.278212 Transcript_96386/m.278212 type:complete len:338 (-) Transcript_96386:427-1440(-)